MYLFEGETIKLNENDYRKCEKEYPNIDLTKQLRQLDMQLKGKRNWYYPMHQILAYRNSSKTYKADATRDRAIHDQLTDTSWAR